MCMYVHTVCVWLYICTKYYNFFLKINEYTIFIVGVFAKILLFSTDLLTLKL